ncbi:hypothetical protein BIY37_08280 [Candidatus Brocadia sapporoensis]|uniref:Uncharacterized protein n=1 Tax=Candidatus Brocadia sapporoensis TaxID=392547 RepID=A0A1V6LZB0_9BACT|nr:hypothetical protein BIY37_08280 [Candidatus Brocadia sapporoensis]
MVNNNFIMDEIFFVNCIRKQRITRNEKRQNHNIDLLSKMEYCLTVNDHRKAINRLEEFFYKRREMENDFILSHVEFIRFG